MTQFTCWAPGRVNLIGEHIDYCGGTVLPMPIQYGTTVRVRRRTDDRIVARSDTHAEPVSFSAGQSCPVPVGHWGCYVYGAVRLVEELTPVSGLSIEVSGNIPGSGLSSSASLCVALLGAVCASQGLSPDGLKIAHLARRIEHDYVQVLCGLMDQAVVTLGEPAAALCFDCADETSTSCPIDASAPAIVVLDSGVPRRLTESAYNKRLAEVGRAASALNTPLETLAHASMTDLDEAAAQIDPTAYRRARHVISEQQRVCDAVAQIREGQWSTFGQALNASHASLRDDYEVSCAELDLLVELLCATPEVLGARLTGAGFGGCVVALIAGNRTADVLTEPTERYRARANLQPRWFEARSEGGLRHDRTTP